MNQNARYDLRKSTDLEEKVPEEVIEHTWSGKEALGPCVPGRTFRSLECILKAEETIGGTPSGAT